jgi:protein gp37
VANLDIDNPAIDWYEEQQIERHRERHDYEIKAKALFAIQNAAVVVDVARDNLFGHECSDNCEVCRAIDKLRKVVDQIDDVAALIERVG